ncbi:YadA-like family protein [Haemophilus haemolyticus]|uniref:YadA-like family protein n=1 Tax=Haemophilus haemolyticus TaxID=726 RepID=UPI000E5882A5|nr:YadA-like family protein [Haemophilus haemolyticus]
MMYNLPASHNLAKHSKNQPHFSAKISLVSLSLFSALSAPAWADNVTLTQEEYNTLINRITQLEQKMGENTNGSTTVGKNSQAALFGTAVGMNAQATGNQSTTVGVNSEASGSNSAAIGLGAKATKTDAIAMGTNSQATGINTTALGAYAEATDQYGIAVGADAYSVGERAIAIGVHTSTDEMKKFYDDPNQLRMFLNYETTIKNNITDEATLTSLLDANQGEANLATLIQDNAKLIQLIPEEDKRNKFIDFAQKFAKARNKLNEQKTLYPNNPELARFGLANPFGATGGQAVAIGNESLASGVYSVALGAESKATNYASIATGYKAKATGMQALANGFAAEATGDFSSSIGTAAKAMGYTSIALGYGSNAGMTEAIAIGSGAKVKIGGPDFRGSIAIGRNANSQAGLSIAIGADSVNHDGGVYSGNTAVGTGAVTGKSGSKQEPTGATAIGNGAHANTDEISGEILAYGTAIGTSSNAQGTYSSALGTHSRAMGHYSVSIGVQNDTKDHTHGAWGYGSNAIGLYAHARGIYSSAIGSKSESLYNNSVAFGYQAQTKAVNAVSVGTGAQTTGVNSVALGPSAMATFDSTVALGDNSLANTKSDVIGFDPLGYASTAYNATKPETLLKDMSTVLSTEKLEAYNNLRAKIIELDEKIFSYNEILKVSEYDRLYGKTEDIRNKASETTAKMRKNRDDAIAAKKLALAEIQANYNDANTWRSSAGAVSVGNSDLGITRQITNVAAGSEDTDAVNVAQLKALAAAPVQFYNGGSVNGANFNIGTQLGTPFNLTNLRFSFGNGLKASLQKDQNNNQVLFMELDSDAIKANPDLKGQNGRDGRDGKDGQNGRDGINGRDGVDGRDGNSLTPNDIVNVKEVHTGNTVMNTNGVTINKGGKTVSITENGLDNGGNKVVNVAAGEISATSKEAVNGQQLYEINQSVAQNTRSINHLNNKMDEVDRRGRRGVAIAGAMGLLPQPHTSGRSSISTATTYYRGEQALAVGYSRLTDNGKHIVKFSGASNMSGKKDVMVGAAYGYEW